MGKAHLRDNLNAGGHVNGIRADIISQNVGVVSDGIAVHASVGGQVDGGAGGGGAWNALRGGAQGVGAAQAGPSINQSLQNC